MSDWLSRALEASRTRGFLGPGPLPPHIEHSEGFIDCWKRLRTSPPIKILDLGTGGGLPGLVLLDRWDVDTVLTDSMVKRARFLEEVIEWPGAPSHGSVVTGRVEELSRIDGWPDSCDLVTARAFGTPAATAECAARFLVLGGLLIVSEPPEESAGRWSAEGLGRLGLRSIGRQRTTAAFQVIEKVVLTPDAYPRASGTPQKKPLF